MINNLLRQKLAYDFIVESNKIEGILRDPTEEEMKEFFRFMELPLITVEELQKFVSVYQPNAKLRDKYGMDVRVGRYYPPQGGPNITRGLNNLLDFVNHPRGDAYDMHLKYEGIHPFTDCNGRSGRMMWAWKMGWDGLTLGFLHKWYYQTLSASR